MDDQRSGRTHAQVVVVGAGFSGIGVAHRLKQDGVEELLILEREREVGGVWQANTYPGCTCDVPSHLYSFSFAPNPDWSSTYSPQREIRDYLVRCVDDFGLRPHLRLGVELQEASWRDDERVWELATSAGVVTADVLISAVGPLTEPKLPDVPGIERFEGTVMHSARWDHDHNLTGERVASIGTGASAIQYVPEIAQVTEHLYVFQRSAPWVMPHPKRPIRDAERAVYRRFPLAQKAVRAAIYANKELLILGFVKYPALMDKLAGVPASHRAKQISDPQLLAAVTPDYTLGCKRLVPSNRWYPTLARPDVDLVTSALSEVRQRSVVDADGVERDVDTIIFGTGYHVTDIPVAEHVHGRDGRLLSDVWQGSPRAYLGASIPDFPNFFMLLGPNTGLGHSSMVYMIEAQIEHVRGALAALRRPGTATGAATAGARAYRGATIEVTHAAHDAYNREVEHRMGTTVWEVGGCSSFYFDAHGRNATLWPDWTWRFRRRARRFDPTAYQLTAPGSAETPGLRAGVAPATSGATDGAPR